MTKRYHGRDAGQLFSVPAKDARAALRNRVAQGDTEPLQIWGTWLAPLYWWREVLAEAISSSS